MARGAEETEIGSVDESECDIGVKRLGLQDAFIITGPADNVRRSGLTFNHHMGLDSQ